MIDGRDATMHRIYCPAIAVTIMAGLLAVSAAFAASEYLRLKWAIAEASAKMAAGVERHALTSRANRP